MTGKYALQNMIEGNKRYLEGNLNTPHQSAASPRSWGRSTTWIQGKSPAKIKKESGRGKGREPLPRLERIKPEGLASKKNCCETKNRKQNFFAPLIS